MQALDYRRRLGERIRKLRDKKGWSQEEFADSCEVNRSYMGRIERGELNLTLDTVKKVAEGLGISVSTLLKGIL
ncbi:MAG TPA: helix-turn-helix transcriptional regulator [Terriglobales bacterium]|nr:helix-turn-helix transcriptional regulator [Terriglobales bacterium]